jgi:hypothetical protein
LKFSTCLKIRFFFSEPAIQLGYVNQGKGKILYIYIYIYIYIGKSYIGLKKKSKPNKGKGVIGFEKLSIQVKGKGNILSSIIYLLCRYKWLNIG